MGDTLLRAGLCAISVGVAALAIGSTTELAWSPAAPADAGLQTEQSGDSVSTAFDPGRFDALGYAESQVPAHPGLRLASLETGVDGTLDQEKPEVAPRRRASFDERFASAFGREPLDEDEPRVRGGPVWLLSPPVEASPAPPGTAAPRLPLPRIASLTPADTLKHATAPSGASQSANVARLLPAGPNQAVPTEGRSDGVPPPDPAHTAVYDIGAHVVYLPNGEKLEAHSGLGSHLDDVRYVSVRGQGPTPPNVYELVLRKQPFHGVQAIRLIPVGDGNMFGRDGILAHPYMLGPNGQSNGCVSFVNYPAFLNAFLKGEVDRLVVVDHLATPPSPTIGLQWLPEALRNLFKPS